MNGRLSATLGAVVLSVIVASAIQAQGGGTEPTVACRVVGRFISLNSTTWSITVDNRTPTPVVIPITPELVKEAEKLKVGDRIEIDLSAAGPDNRLLMGAGGPAPPNVLMLRKASKPGCSCDGGADTKDACENGWACNTISVYGFTCGCVKQ